MKTHSNDRAFGHVADLLEQVQLGESTLAELHSVCKGDPELARMCRSLKALLLGAEARGAEDSKSAEEKLRKIQAHLADAERIARVGSWDWSVQNGDFYWSDEAYRIFGLDKETFQPTYESVIAKMHPDDQGPVGEAVAKTLARDNSYSVKYRIIRPNGEVRLLISEGQRELDSEGNPLRLYGAVWDITERSLLEAKEVVHSQKLQTIGELAGGIAHDFNNTLQVIVGNVDCALRKQEEGSKEQSWLKKAMQACERAAELIDQILCFGSHDQRPSEDTCIDAVVNDAMKLLRPSLPSTIDIQSSCEESNLRVKANPSEVYQVLLNLATNAFHAIGAGGGRISIKVDTVQVDDALPEHTPQLTPGAYARLSVVDDGEGIQQELLDKIFAPYFTTKNGDQGRGLGLAVVSRIMRDSGGTITVDSMVGQGATFRAYFPLSQQASSEDAESAEAGAITGTERVLLVDDEDAVARQFEEGLQLLGYRVSVFNTSSEALAEFKKRPEAFDAVITDQTMPYPRGDELARAILALRPRLPIILCTGFSELITAEQARDLGILGYVKKPARIADLALALRRALSHSGRR